MGAKIKIQNRKLGRERAKGLYHWPTKKGGVPLIEVDPRQEPLDELDTVLHESLHHCLPDLTEEKVTEVATAMAKIAWEYGYRKVTQ